MKKLFLIPSIIITILISLCFIPFSINKFIPLLKEQFESQYGIIIETEKLTCKFGPSITIKSPKLDFFLSDNNKIATLSGIKIKISVLDLLKKRVKIKNISVSNADLFVKLDKNGNIVLLKNIKNKNCCIDYFTGILLRKYNCSIIDGNGQIYKFIGNDFSVYDFKPNKHIKLITKGCLFINQMKYMSYDVSVDALGLNNLTLKNINFLDFLRQIKDKKATANLLVDLKVKIDKNNFNADGSVSLDKLTCVLNDVSLPYSNANFTLLGNKVTVSSTLYTNKINKINVNGYFIHSNNPSFNLAVKSNGINLKDVLCFVRLFSDISNLNQIKDINGTLCSDFILKGSLKKLKSSGFFKISNANIITDKFIINNLNSDIDFTDNNIVINTTNAYVNSAPITLSGNIISNKLNINLDINKYSLKNFKYDKLNLTNGILSLAANLTGTLDDFVPKIKAEITNCVGTYQNAGLKLERVSFNSFNKSNANLKLYDGSIKLPNCKMFSFTTLSALVNNSNIIVEPFTCFSDNTKFDVYGKVLNYNNKDLTFLFKGNGFINIGHLFNVSELDNSYPCRFEFLGDRLSQYINLQLLDHNSKAKISFAQSIIINFVAKYSSNELKIIDCSFNNFTGCFSDSLKKNLSQSTKLATLTGSIINNKVPKFKNMKFSTLTLLPLNIYHYAIKFSANITLNGDFLNPELIGNLKIPVASDKYGCLFVKNFNALLTKNIINFDCSQIKLFDSSMSIVGTAKSNLLDKIRIKTLNVKSKDLDLDNLIMLFILLKDLNLNINVDNGIMFAEKVILHTPNGLLQLSDLNSSFKLNDNMLTVNPLSANMYNGKIQGKLLLNVISLAYDAYIQGRGISVGPVTLALTKLKDNISGKLDFDMEVKSILNSKFLKNANIKFIIHDGQMNTLGKVEHLLYAQNIVADRMLKTSWAVVGRAISAKDTGLFKYLNGIVTVKNELINIDSMKMLGPNMSLYITGDYGLMSNVANLNILGRLSNTIVSSLGAFGTFTMEKFKVALTGNDTESLKVLQNGVENIPQLSQRATKEFKATISGPAESSSSVKSFFWISESIKEYKTREINQSNETIPQFIENLPY